MNKKLALTFLSTPSILGSMLSVLMVINPVHAAEPEVSVTERCWDQSKPNFSRLTCARLSETTQLTSTDERIEAQGFLSDEPPLLEFTEEESDAAIQLFGCDCIVCINAIRQMRGLSPLS